MTLEVLGEDQGFYHVHVSKADGDGFVKKDDVVSQIRAEEFAMVPPSRAGAARPQSPTSPAKSAATAQSAIGVIVIVCAFLAILSCLLPWTGFQRSSANAFEQGYITGDGYWAYSDNPGNDGLLILVAACAAGGIAIHYFFCRSALAGLGVLTLGAAIAAIGCFNAGKILQEVHDTCSTCGVTQGLGDGIYITIAAGAAIAFTALVGFLLSAASTLLTPEYASVALSGGAIGATAASAAPASSPSADQLSGSVRSRGTVSVRATGAPVYSRADPASKLTTRLGAGMTLEVLEEASGFYHVHISKADGDGYIRKDDVMA